MNLLLNAVDAVDKHGAVRVSSSVDRGDVVVTVTDGGHGIAPDHVDQIFDPFFTTKRTGEGTGLGLSISLGIVQAHGGHIDVVSTPGQETTFAVRLPATPANLDEEIRP